MARNDRWDIMVDLQCLADECRTYAGVVDEIGDTEAAAAMRFLSGRLRAIVMASGADMGGPGELPDE